MAMDESLSFLVRLSWFRKSRPMSAAPAPPEAPPSEAQRLADLTGLLEVSRQLSASLELDRILSFIGSACLKVLDCERNSIFLYDEANDELYSRVATGTSGALEIRFPAS